MVLSTPANFHAVVSTKGYNTAENRNWITAKAFQAGCTHLLLLDDDMVYTPDGINKLLAHKKEIVGAKYSVRRIVEDKSINHEVIEYGDDRSETDLFKCQALGGGLLLIDLSIIPKMKTPLFWYKVLDIGMVEMSNDWWFCERAREAGYDVWCDPTIKLGHIGEYEY